MRIEGSHFGAKQVGRNDGGDGKDQRQDADGSTRSGIDISMEQEGTMSMMNVMPVDQSSKDTMRDAEMWSEVAHPEAAAEGCASCDEYMVSGVRSRVPIDEAVGPKHQETAPAEQGKEQSQNVSMLREVRKRQARMAGRSC